MALNPKLAVGIRNSALDGLSTALGSYPLMRWYDGEQPTDADTALGGQIAGVELACSATFAESASGGSMTVNTITGANATATLNPCTWHSFLTSAGVRKFDGSCGTSSANFILSSVTIGSGAACTCTSYVFTMAAG